MVWPVVVNDGLSRRCHDLHEQARSPPSVTCVLFTQVLVLQVLFLMDQDRGHIIWIPGISKEIENIYALRGVTQQPCALRARLNREAAVGQASQIPKRISAQRTPRNKVKVSRGAVTHFVRFLSAP